MKYHYFAYLSRLKHIQRWGLMRNTRMENTLEHSMMCVYLAHGLAMIGNRIYGKNYPLGEILLAAAYHDAPEVITGDLATPIKYFNPQLRQAYQKVESVAAEKLVAMLPQELQKDMQHAMELSETATIRPIIKAADKLCAYIKCKEELKAGNREFEKAEANIYAALKEMKMPEIDYFLENFMESFSLTLDELN